MWGSDLVGVGCFLGLILCIGCLVLLLPCIGMECLWHVHGTIQYGIGYLQELVVEGFGIS